MFGLEGRASRIEELLACARRRLTRLTPRQAVDRMRSGALLVDTRPFEQRLRGGDIPGAVIVDRNVLEWRLDPTSPDRIPEMDTDDRLVIIICNEGYSSSLVAATLAQLGLHHPTDVIGGFQAWLACGLPVVPCRDDLSLDDTG
jgi:rhodanese-related sulfurtransferase